MGSMAFWAKQKAAQGESRTSVVLNFNLWTQCDKKVDSFIDIGFKITDIFSSEKMTFFIPFGSKSDIKDLSSLIHNTNVIGVIFNEKYSVTDLPDTKCFWPVTDIANDKTAFIIYSWESHAGQSAISFKDAYNGVCCEIDVNKLESQIDSYNNPNVTKKDDYYFRFRIKVPDSDSLDAIIKKYVPADSFLQSTFATTYIVDFRFNDIRSLPEGVNSAVIEKDNDFVAINKLHFLLMTKAHVDVETGTKDVSIRELELNTWDSYVENRFDTKDIVAYHEKVVGQSQNIRRWEFFAKLKVNNSTLKIILTYLLALGVITIGYNIISAWICTLIGL